MTPAPDEIPDGFGLCNRNAFEAGVGPFFERWDTSIDGQLAYILAVRIGPRHLGAPGRSHGGFVLALLDQAMGTTAHRVLGELTYTISMSTDFIGPAEEGVLLEVHAQATAMTRSYVFMSAHAEAEGRSVATAKGVWVRRRGVAVR